MVRFIPIKVFYVYLNYKRIYLYQNFMSQYNFTPKSRPDQKLETSGSFGFKSSQFSQKNNLSVDRQVKINDPSIFNQSSIQKLNTSQSGDFIYFQNDFFLSQLQNDNKDKKKTLQKSSKQQKKRKNAIDFSKSISFQDSLRKDKNQSYKNDYQIKQYGMGKSDLPPTLKKPKFGFKISETAESSQIINEVGSQYQINLKQNLKSNPQNNINSENSHNNQSKNLNAHEISNGSLFKSQKSVRKQDKLKKKDPLISIKHDLVYLRKDESISSIRNPDHQAQMISKQISQSKSLNGSMNFKSVFKNKVQKASSINSSLSKRHNGVKSNKSINAAHDQSNPFSEHFFPQKQVKMAELKDLHQLENKLGQLKHENKKIIQYLIEKDEEIQKLKKKKKQIESEDPYAVVKQNQLMKAFLSKKNKNEKSRHLLQSQNDIRYLKNLNSAKSLKQISLKKNSQISSLHDYDVKEYKFRVEPHNVTKRDKTFILTNRGMLHSQRHLDVGYSLKQDTLTIYLTLKKQYDQVRVKLQQNSFILSQPIDRVFRDSPLGKQIKFKTRINSTKCSNPEEEFSPMCLKVSLSAEHKFQNKLNQVKIPLPILVYNIARQIQPQSCIQSTDRMSRVSGREVYKTQSFVGCKQIIKSPETYLLKLFPTGVYSREDNVFQAGFLWKDKNQLIKIKIKQRSFVLQGEGNPNKGTFELLRSIVGLLAEQKSQN